MYLYLKTQVDAAMQAEASTSARYEDLGILSNWLENAAAINANDGSFKSEFVRGAVDAYSLLQNGTGISNERFQGASDKLAHDVYTDIVKNQGILSAEGIITTDVQSAVIDLGLVNQSGWAGTAGDWLPTWMWGLGKDMVSIDTNTSFLNWLAEAAKVLLANGGGVGRVMGSKFIDFLHTLTDHPNFSSGDPFTGMPWPGGSINLWEDAENTTSPLILDLDGDGVETRNKTAGIYFDHGKDGFAENTGWVGQDDGLLVRDVDGDGKITSGRELFGNHTLLKTGKEAANGFDALKDLDDNGDGFLDSQDAVFTSLKVWKDLNSEGITDDGELMTLAQAEVQNLKVAYANPGTTAPKDAQGNQHQQLGSPYHIRSPHASNFPEYQRRFA